MTNKKQKTSEASAKVDVLGLINELEQKKDALRPVSLTAGSGLSNGLRTGCFTLDLISGGGIPKGRISMFYGTEGSGKSTLMYTMCANLHKDKIPTLFFDFEAASDPDYMTRVGMDLLDSSGLTRYYQPESGDQAYRKIMKILKLLPDHDGVSPAPCAFIIDSISAMPSQAEMDEPDKQPMGARARMHSSWLGKLKTLNGRKGCSIIAVNQTRMKIGVMFGNPEIFSGGEAWKFYPDHTVRVSKVGKLVEVGSEQFTTLKMTTKKNKHFQPFQTAEVYLHLGKGIAFQDDVVKFLKLAGYMSTRGTPKVLGLDRYCDEGITLDKKYKSSSIFEEFILDNKELLSTVLSRALKDDACLRYLGVKQGYSVEELYSGIHFDDAMINSDKLENKHPIEKLEKKPKKPKKVKKEKKVKKDNTHEPPVKEEELVN